MHLTLWQASVNPCLHQRLLNSHRQGCLSLLWDHCSFLLGSGTRKTLLCPPKACFLEGAQSFGWIPRLGNLLWALELLQKCENFFGRIVLQFVCCLLSSSMVALMQHTPRSAPATDPVPTGAKLCLPRRHSNTQS